MASDSKHAEDSAKQSISVNKLVISPEETKDLSAPVNINVELTLSQPVQCAVWVLRLEVDTSSDANTERHVLPLAAASLGFVSFTCSASLATPVWPAASVQQAQAEGCTGALLRLSLYDAPMSLSHAATLQSHSKYAVGSEDPEVLEALVASTAGLQSLLDVSCLVDIEDEDGSGATRNIYNPFE